MEGGNVSDSTVGNAYAIGSAVMEKEFVQGGLRKLGLILLSLVGAVFVTLPGFAVPSVVVSWDASPSPEVTGYNVYYGPVSGVYTNMLVAGNSTSLLVGGLVEGATYYFSATAYDATGVESDLANEAVHTVPGGSGSAGTPPTISVMGNQSIAKNTTLGPISFTVDDPDSSVDGLTLAGFSSDSTLVPLSSFVFGGSGANRTVQITPAADRSGAVSIGIIVTDEAGQNAYASFSLTVIGNTGTPGASPVISALPNVTLLQNSSGTNLHFVVTDTDTSAGNLSLSVGGDNPVLLPYGNRVLSGSGSSRTLRLTPALNQTGVSQVVLVAADNNGHTCTNSFTVTVVTDPLARTLTLLTNGNGTVSPDLSAQALKVGKTYSITAKPALGNLFVNWTGTIESTSPKLTITMVSNMVLQANFIPDPMFLSGGNYNGLFSESSGVKVESAGFFTASLTRSGKYSGRVKIGTGSYPISGKINFQCQATNLIKRGTNILTLVFQADQAGGITGQLRQDSWVAWLNSDRAGFHAKTNPAPQAGRYTVLLPGQPGDQFKPNGSSFAAMKISTAGVASYVGTLADGSKASQSVPLSADGQWPLHLPLYSGKGLMMSWQAFQQQLVNKDFEGWLVWIRPTNSAAKLYPAGFNYQRPAYGVVYVPPMGTNTVLNSAYVHMPFFGGDLDPGFNNYVRIGLGNKITNLSSNEVSMSFSPSTGVFSGKVKDPVTHASWSFSGAILQAQNEGFGFVTGTNKNGGVYLFPH